MAESVSVFNYILKRVLIAIPLIFCIMLFNFFLIHLVPGSPVYVFIGSFRASPEYIAMMTQKMGLDKPVHIQLVIYISRILQGDLGTSYIYFQPVSRLIFERIWNTLLLVALSMFWSTIVGITLGVIQARKPFSLIDNFISLISVLGYSMPYFWLGLLLIMFFSLRLGMFPIGGLRTLGVKFDTGGYIIDRLRHAFLPSLTMGIFQFAVITRLTRATLHEVLRQDYIMMAWSKGLKERTILLKHSLRNALLPIVTIIGLRIGYAVSGAILTETVFSYPGIGRLMYDSLISRDYPVMLGILFITSITIILANLVVDILYTFIDPRVKYE